MTIARTALTVGWKLPYFYWNPVIKINIESLDTESSGSSDSDDDSDEDSGKGEADPQESVMLDASEYTSQLTILEQAIINSPFQYQSYIDIIKLAKNNTDFTKLREYRQKMSEMFPLTESN